MDDLGDDVRQHACMAIRGGGTNGCVVICVKHSAVSAAGSVMREARCSAEMMTSEWQAATDGAAKMNLGHPLDACTEAC